MPETIGEAFVTIRPDTTGFAQAADSSIKSGLTTLAKGVGTVLAARAVKDFIGSSIDEAREAQKVGAQTTAVIKSQGAASWITRAAVEALSGSLSNKAGVDDEVIQAGENMLLTFRNIRNETGKGNDIFNRASKATLDMATAFSKANGTELDLQSASIQLGKALNDPVEGVTALQRVGVRLTDQQKEQVKAFVASGDVLSAQKVILDEVTREFGGSAAAQATSADKLNVAWKNVQEALGTALLPMIDFVANIGTPVAQYLSQHTELATALAAVIGGVLVTALIAYTINMIAAAAATLAAAAPFIAIGIAIAAVVAAIYFLWTNWDQVWGWIQNHPAYAAVVALISLPLATFVLLIGGLKELYDNWDAIWGAIESTTAAAAAFIIGVIDDVKQAIRDLKGLVSGSGSFGEDVDRARALQRSFANAPTFTAPGPYGFASGGRVPGYGNTDSVPAMLTPGEFVVKADGSNLPRGGLFDGATVVIGDTGVISDLDYWQRTRMAGV